MLGRDASLGAVIHGADGEGYWQYQPGRPLNVDWYIITVLQSAQFYNFLLQSLRCTVAQFLGIVLGGFYSDLYQRSFEGEKKIILEFNFKCFVTAF